MRDSSATPARRRGAPLLWLAGAIAATLLVLGVTGTLSSWTSAIISNSNNSAASATSVALIETQTAPVNALALPCDTAASTTNAVTCATINKYGGIGSAGTANANDAYGAPLTPGGTPQAVTVNLKNDGTGSGTLVLAAGACANLAYPGSTGADTTDYNLCTQMHLAVACSTPSTFTYSGTVGLFTGGSIGALGATVSTNCTFTVSLPSTTPAGYASQYVTQALTWTLTAP
ncbi:MAG TPA: hypothetical protein VGN35_08960 [Jatrophihabitantaceae bacterium]|jgi:hypothetical protein|nr:hypothetical protein [Jatrophihabitantaceae bacterium]